MSDYVPIVSTECSECNRKVELKPSAIRLLLHSDPMYAYECPICHEWVRREATDEVVGFLKGAAGVVPLVEAHGPRLTEDDLIEFGRTCETSLDTQLVRFGLAISEKETT